MTTDDNNWSVVKRLNLLLLVFVGCCGFLTILSFVIRRSAVQVRLLAQICLGRSTENSFPVLRDERIEHGKAKLLDLLLTESSPESSTGDDEQEALAAKIEELESRLEELEARQREAEDIAQRALEMIYREAEGKDSTFCQRRVLAELQRMRQ